MVEYSLIVSLLLVLTFGLVEFSLALFQWNSATKAVQAGARLAAVSAPVSSDLTTLTGLTSGVEPGDPMPAFERICTGAGGSCSGGGTFSAAALNTIVFGRGDGTTCGTVAAAQLPGMCDMFSRIQPQHVTVTYKHTGLGFAGRPGGPVPTITVQLSNLTFNFILLRILPGFTSIAIPSMRTTITGEDLSTTN